MAEFTPEFFRGWNGDVISHDPRLNEDGDTLYRFLKKQANIPPKYTLICRGEHRERKRRKIKIKDSEKRTEKEVEEEYTETIQDFDLRINLNQYFKGPPVIWSKPDLQPAYRGAMVREIETPRHGCFVPTYEDNQRLFPSEPYLEQSFRSLRQWVDEYCTSPKLLKEFIFQKIPYGWDTSHLEEAVEATIRSVHYTGTTRISFNTSASRIIIRPDNWLSRALSKGWVKVLLWVVPVYPFIWLWKRYGRHGGGTWAIAGSAYALKRLEPDPAVAGSTITVGLCEGEWLKRWEGTIRGAVIHGFKSNVPRTDPDGEVPATVAALDGYPEPVMARFYG